MSKIVDNIFYVVNLLTAIISRYRSAEEVNDKSLLKVKDKRGRERRLGTDRREEGAQYTDGLTKRVRVGSQLEYFRATRRGVLENVELRYSDIMKLRDAVRVELKKYRLNSKYNGRVADIDGVLNDAVESVRDALDLAGRNHQSVGKFIDGVVERVSHSYYFEPIDRRGSERRKSLVVEKVVKPDLVKVGSFVPA